MANCESSQVQRWNPKSVETCQTNLPNSEVGEIKTLFNELRMWDGSDIPDGSEIRVQIFSTRGMRIRGIGLYADKIATLQLIVMRSEIGAYVGDTSNGGGTIIHGSAPPFIDGNYKNYMTSLSGWDTDILDTQYLIYRVMNNSGAAVLGISTRLEKL